MKGTTFKIWLISSFSIQQQFKFEEHFLNNIAEVKSTASNATSKTADPTQRRRNYTSSISALSTVSATAAATNEYLANIDSELCFTALEFVLTLLASQSLLALKDINLSQREKQLIKRELSTELSVFYDFVKKRILPEIARDEPLRRKKHGCRAIGLSNEQLDEINRQASGSGRKSVSNSDRMRINVMRKLHLNQKSPGTSSPSPNAGFNMTQPFSPIGGSSSGFGQRSNDRFDLPSSTPAQPFTKRTTNDDNEMDQSQEEIQLFFEPEDPSFCELSLVQLIEEDYLQFLSNLFGYICHTEKIN